MGGANDPLRPSAAQKVIQRIARTGACSFSRHAAEQLRKRNLTTVDCLNTLAAGVVRPAEWENGTWRYRVESHRIAVVVAIESGTEIRVVTAWRIAK